jgi:hypothetical protein
MCRWIQRRTDKEKAQFYLGSSPSVWGKDLLLHVIFIDGVWDDYNDALRAMVSLLVSEIDYPHRHPFLAII